jgi:glycosyltransferase involved in cell wall biosynthesis
MIMALNSRNNRLLQSLGFRVVVTADFEEPRPVSTEKIPALRDTIEDQGVFIENLPFPRAPGTRVPDLRVERQLATLRQRYDLSLIHAHSPIEEASTRLVFGRNSGRMIYTAHGFAFFQGGPWIDWPFYCPVEAWLSSYTDCLVVINDEDKSLAWRRLHAVEVVHIPGVGSDWQPLQVEADHLASASIRNDPGIARQCTERVSFGELIRRKSHVTAITALALVTDWDLHYVICGIGPLHDALVAQAESLGVSIRVHLVGHVDSRPYLRVFDSSVLPSVCEGLGLSELEAMAVGLPPLAFDRGGIRNYLHRGKGGVAIHDPKDPCEVAYGISRLATLTPEDHQVMAGRPQSGDDPGVRQVVGSRDH